jgi:hypothetical protein
MLPACAAALSVLIAAQAGAQGEPARVASAKPAPAPLIQELVLEGLSPKPLVVERKTDTYGTVTIDHEKHLQLRAPCQRCHDPGPVTKIDFKPKIAHQRCIGCHKELQAGPSHCMGCHVKTVPSKALADAAPEGSTDKVVVASMTPAPKAPLETVSLRPSSRHAFGVGLVAGDGIGFSLRISTRGERFFRAYTAERLSSGGSSRFLTTLDLGVAHSPVPHWTAFAVGVVGVDAQDQPDAGFAPALGLRVGAEWTPPDGWPISSVYLSLSAIDDLGFRSYGYPTDGLRVFGTIGTGIWRRD